jgi:hypothetical protein
VASVCLLYLEIDCCMSSFWGKEGEEGGVTLF